MLKIQRTSLFKEVGMEMTRANFCYPSFETTFKRFFPRIFLIFCFLFKRRIKIDRAIDLETSWNKHLDRPIIFHSIGACATCWRACVLLSSSFRNRRVSIDRKAVDQRFVERGINLSVLRKSIYSIYFFKEGSFPVYLLIIICKASKKFRQNFF